MEQDRRGILDGSETNKMCSLNGNEAGEMCSPADADTCGNRLFAVQERPLNQRVSAISSR